MREVVQPGAVSKDELRGKVSDLRGRGIPGAAVLVFAADLPENLDRDSGSRARIYLERFLGKVAGEGHRRAIAETPAGKDGRYRIPLAGILPGSYLVLARHPGFVPSSQNWTRADGSAEVNFQLAPGEFIKGAVVDEKRKPIPGAEVEAVREDEDWWASQAVQSLVDRAATTDDGLFQLAVPPGTFRLGVRAQGFLSEEVRAVASGTEDLEIVLQPSLSLAVRVTSERQPVEGALLTIYSPTGEGWWQGQPDRAMKLIGSPQARGQTDSGGSCLFTGLPSRHYYLSVEKSGLVTRWTQGELEGGRGPTSIEVAMSPATILRGVVRDPDRRPVAGALVAIGKDRSRKEEEARQWRREQRRLAGGESPGASAAGEAGEEDEKPPEPLSPWHAEAGSQTDGEGRFTFDTLPRGSYSLSVQSDAFTPYRQDGLRLEEPTELEITLRAGIRIEGTVLSSAAGGGPVPGARLEVRAGDSDQRQVRADAEGRFAIGGLHPGRLPEIAIDAQGYSITLVKDLLVESSPALQRHDFKLDPAPAAGGTVTDAQGAAVPGARVRIGPATEGPPGKEERREPGPRSVQTSTDGEGRFAIAEVKACCQLQVMIEHPDFKRFISAPFAVEPGGRLEDLRFQLATSGRLAAWVKDQEGQPVPGATVRLTPRLSEKGAAEWRHAKWTTRPSGPDGKAVFGGIEGGAYVVSCAAPGFRQEALPATVVDDQESTVVFRLQAELAITGLVTDSQGNPLPGTYLLAWREREGLPPERSVDHSRGNGAFRLRGLGTGAYSLQVNHRGFVERRLQVESGTSVTVPLEGFGGIAGRVLAAGTDLPVTRYRIRLLPEAAPADPGPSGKLSQAERSASEWRTIEDNAGAFRLEDIAPGSYALKVVVNELSGGEARVRVEEGRFVENVLLRIEEGLSIAGVAVHRFTAAPIAGAKVYLIPLPAEEESGKEAAEGPGRQTLRKSLPQRREAPDPGAPAEESRLAKALERKALERDPAVETDESGAFRLQYVEPGRYQVVVHHDLFLPFRQRVEISADRSAPEVAAQLDPGETLRGEVRLPDGSAAAGVLVRLRNEQGTSKRAITDRAGRYAIGGLAPGPHRFAVLDGQGGTSPSSVVLIGTGGENRFDYQLGGAQEK